MDLGSQSLLIGAVPAVGILHTLVPDHWFPITVLARQRGWSKSETARVAFQAGAQATYYRLSPSQSWCGSRVQPPPASSAPSSTRLPASRSSASACG